MKTLMQSVNPKAIYAAIAIVSMFSGIIIGMHFTMFQPKFEQFLVDTQNAKQKLVDNAKKD